MTREYIRIMNRKIDKSILFTDGAFVCDLRKKILVLHILLLIIITIYLLFLLLLLCQIQTSVMMPLLLGAPT